MTLLAVLAAPEKAPHTNRGVYTSPGGWSEPEFDYYRASSPTLSADHLVSVLTDALGQSYRDVHRAPGAAVKHYSQHVELRDWRGMSLASVFWGGQNVLPNVQAKGSYAPAVAAALRSLGPHKPSRVDVKRDATAEGLFGSLRALALAYSERLGLAFSEIANHHEDKGDTLYLGSRVSQVLVRIYQPGLKRAQEEGRTGPQISAEERNAVRVELEFKPQKQRAKKAAATLAPSDMWGISEWVAEFSSEVFAMDVQPISISERRESNRERALRFMGKQYGAHLKSLWDELEGDTDAFACAIADFAGIERRPH